MKNELTQEELNEIHEKALKRFDIAKGFWEPIFQQQLVDEQFCSGAQWTPSDSSARTAVNLVVTQINMCNQFTSRIIGEAGKQIPSIKVNSSLQKTSKEKAETLQGYIKNIENNSTSTAAYLGALEDAVIGGCGWLRIFVDVNKYDPFEQELYIEHIENFASVFIDPNFKTIDGSDAEYGFIFDDIDTETFHELYPDESTTNNSTFTSAVQHWFPKDKVRITEYYTKYKRQDVLVKVKDNATGTISRIYLSEMTDENDNLKPEFAQTQIIEQKTVMKTEVICSKMNGNKILEYYCLPLSFLPIVFVQGEKNLVNNNGKGFNGIIKHLRDPQTALNYYASTEIDLIQKMPRVPYIAAVGQISSNKDAWEKLNVSNSPLLTYDPIVLAGTVLPPPQRVNYTSDISNIIQFKESAFQQMQRVVGIFDISLAGTAGFGISNDTSGKAMILKQEYQNTPYSKYLFALNRAVEQLGRILIEYIPLVISTERIIRVVRDDDTVDMIAITPDFFDQDVESLDVSVAAGMNFASRKQEAVSMILQLLQYVPQDAQHNILDLLFQNLDILGSEEMVGRLKRMIDPSILGPDKNGPQLDPAKAQQIIMIQKKDIETLTAQLKDALQKLDNDSVKANAQIETKLIESKTSLALKEMDIEIEKMKIEEKIISGKNQLKVAEVQSTKEPLSKIDSNIEPIDIESLIPKTSVLTQGFDQLRKDNGTEPVDIESLIPKNNSTEIPDQTQNTDQPVV